MAVYAIENCFFIWEMKGSRFVSCVLFAVCYFLFQIPDAIRGSQIEDATGADGDCRRCKPEEVLSRQIAEHSVGASGDRLLYLADKVQRK